MIETLATEVGLFFRSGGFVMYPLFLGTLLLWYTVGLRIYNLRRGDGKSLDQIFSLLNNGEYISKSGVIPQAIHLGQAEINKNHTDPRPYLDEKLNTIELELSSGHLLAQGIVMVSPLLGLLGTVGGMIETFDSLGDMALFTQGGGIAGGISQALISTQMGLIVAIPGLVISRLLKRKEMKLKDELERIKEKFCAINFERTIA